MSILAFNGSPRPKGNSVHLLNTFLDGARESGKQTEIIDVNKIHIRNCMGCLRCNIIKRCALRNDDWTELSQKILDADTIVFASPVYFHHVPAPMKTIIDRFRSFQEVRILENGLRHTPWVKWKKHFILLLSLGSPLTNDTEPIIDLFKFICDELGPENKLTTLIGTRLAVTNQVLMEKDQLEKLYEKLAIPTHLVEADFNRNQELLKQCFELGSSVFDQ